MILNRVRDYMNKKLKVSLGTVDVSCGRVPSTRLNDAEYFRCLGLALSYIKENGSIRNLQLREVASIGYDQAIHFFREPCVRVVFLGKVVQVLLIIWLSRSHRLD